MAGTNETFAAKTEQIAECLDHAMNMMIKKNAEVCVCVSTSVTKSFCFFSTFKSQGGREDLQGSAQRSSLQDPRKRKLITSVYLLVLPQAVTPLFHFLIHGPSCFHPRNLGFAAELHRLFTTAELCSHAQTACSTFQVN